MLLLSTSSLVWYWLHHIFQIVKEAEYDGVDLCIENDFLDAWDGDYIGSLSSEFWVPVVSITAPMTKLDEKKVDKLIKIWEKVWSKVITFSPPHISDKNTKWFRSYLPKVWKNTQISLAVRNVPPKFLFFIIPEYKNSTLDQIKKITGTTTLNIWWIDASSWIDIMKAEQLLNGTIKNVLVSDRSVEKEWLLPWKTRGWVSHLPLESFLMKLKTSGYSESISLKVDPKELWVWDLKRIFSELADFKKYYTKYFEQFS